MENILWERGLLDNGDPGTLLHMTVYVLGLHFAVRGRNEHRRLCLCHEPSQSSVQLDGNGYRFLEYREVCNFSSFIRPHMVFGMLTCSYTLCFVILYLLH